MSLSTTSFCHSLLITNLISFLKIANSFVLLIYFLLQMFLLKIPQGLFGAEVEHRLLSVLELNSRCDQCDAIHWYVVTITVVP